MNQNRNRNKYRPEAVGNYMQRDVVTVAPHETVFEAARKMDDNLISCVAVVADGRAISLVTERTIVGLVAQRADFSVSVGKLPPGPILRIQPRDRVSFVLEQMRRLHVRRAIVEENGILAGIVTQTTLLESYQRILAQVATSRDQLAHQALRDDLTGLFNRRHFNRVFWQEIKRARRYGGLLALVSFDLDHFKKINDRYGHPAGDQVLTAAAHIMQRSARSVDTVARYGGEEFAVLMPVAGTRAAKIYAERVRQRLREQSFHFNNEPVRLTISAGICKWSRELNTVRKMFAAADAALYAAKNSGRDRVVVSN